MDASESTEKKADRSGPSGTRTRDLRIKRPYVMATLALEKPGERDLHSHSKSTGEPRKRAGSSNIEGKGGRSIAERVAREEIARWLAGGEP